MEIDRGLLAVLDKDRSGRKSLLSELEDEADEVFDDSTITSG